MQVSIGDWVEIQAYYASSGRKNVGVAYNGLGVVIEVINTIWAIVDIGPRNVMVALNDITYNHGKNKPS